MSSLIGLFGWVGEDHKEVASFTHLLPQIASGPKLQPKLSLNGSWYAKAIVMNVNPAFKSKKMNKKKIGKSDFTLVFLFFSLRGLKFWIFEPQIRIPCRKLYI